MRLLLDTHVALWAVSQPERLHSSITELIVDPSNLNLVSVASLWEIAIKHALKRFASEMPVSASEAQELFDEAGFSLLGVRAAHAIAVETLPLLHADPFDRLIVAQALSEPLRLVTHDATLAQYSDTVICF